MMRRLVLATVTAVVAMVLSASAENLLANHGFSEGAKGWVIRGCHRLEDGAGMDGSKALVWECSDPKGYKGACVQNPKLKAGCVYRYGALVRRDQAKGLTCVSMEWYSTDGKWLGGGQAHAVQDNDVHVKAGWVKYVGSTARLPKNVGKVDFLLYGGRGATGKAVFDDCFVELASAAKPIGAFRSNAYRNTAAEGKVAFVAQLALGVLDVPADKLAASVAYHSSSGTEKMVSAVINRKSEVVRAMVKVTDMAEGTHPVSFSVVNEEGERVVGAKLDFTRVSKMPWTVVKDAQNRLIVDGKPFFPLGMFATEISEAELDAYCQAPFNYILSYREITDQQRALIAKRGLKYVYCVKNCFVGCREGSGPKLKSKDDEIRCVTEIVKRVKDDPAFLGWYIADEALVSAVPKLTERYELIRKLDPDHPQIGVFSHPESSGEFLPCLDIIGTDPYPIGSPPHGLGVSVAGEWTRQTRELTLDTIPLWQTPQCFDWKWCLPSRDCVQWMPSEGEIRNMCWQCIAEGANGLLPYGFFEIRRGFKGKERDRVWKGVCRVMGEIADLEPVLLYDPGEAPTAEGPNVSARVWRRGQDRYLLVVNGSYKGVRATVTLGCDCALVDSELGTSGKMLSPRRYEVQLPPLGISFVKLSHTGK